MHKGSIEIMAEFRNTLPDSGRVLDVGSLDCNGSYKPLFAGWDYMGLDIVEGKNVDYVSADPYCWDDLEDESVDVVISGQTLEHVEKPEMVFGEIYRVLKRGGRCCIVAPSDGPKHNEPWYGNISERNMRSLAKESGLKVSRLYIAEGSPFKDCVLIAEKI